MKRGFFLLSLLVFVACGLSAQRYSRGHSLWISPKGGGSYIVFQDTIAFFELNGGKNKPYHYLRLDTLNKVNLSLFIGKKGSLSRSGDYWIWTSTDSSSKALQFRLASDQQYKEWVVFINWLAFLDVAHEVEALGIQNEQVSKGLGELFKKRYSMSIEQYELEIQKFHKLYL
jgi:hypothetical protein